MFETQIVLTGILKSNDEYLVVRRSADDDLYPEAWEFPGGHLENGELLIEGLKRELKEEINFCLDFEPKITHYFDELKQKNDKLIHNIEMDFIIEVNKSDFVIELSNEHSEYAWVKRESKLLDDYIKDKLSNI